MSKTKLTYGVTIRGFRAGKKETFHFVLWSDTDDEVAIAEKAESHARYLGYDLTVLTVDYFFMGSETVTEDFLDPTSIDRYLSDSAVRLRELSETPLFRNPAALIAFGAAFGHSLAVLGLDDDATVRKVTELAAPYFVE